MNLAPPRDPFAHWHRVNQLNRWASAVGDRRPFAAWFDWQSAKIRKVGA